MNTFASLLIQQAESLVYVKEQTGHASIQITVDIYGHLVPGRTWQRTAARGNQSATKIEGIRLSESPIAVAVGDPLNDGVGERAAAMFAR